MKKILITGASGFIGGFLVKEALNRGYETWAGVRSTSSRVNLQDERIRFIDLKYSDRESLTAQLADFVREHGPWDYVIHNAGLTKTLDKRNFYRINAQNTANLIEALAASGCKPEKFLLMSSLSSYGRGDEKTFRPISLDDPQLPDTDYGKSKLEAENYLRHQSYFPYVILRPTGVYGPGEKDYFMEIKSVKSGFDFAAVSSSSKTVNANRLQIHALAYNIFNWFKCLALSASMRKQQIDTIRLKLLKIAVRVVHSAIYITFKLCSSCPYKNEFYETSENIRGLQPKLE